MSASKGLHLVHCLFNNQWNSYAVDALALGLSLFGISGMVIANFRILNELIGPVLFIITLDVNENAMLDHLLFANDLLHFVVMELE